MTIFLDMLIVDDILDNQYQSQSGLAINRILMLVISQMDRLRMTLLTLMIFFKSYALRKGLWDDLGCYNSRFGRA